MPADSPQKLGLAHVLRPSLKGLWYSSGLSKLGIEYDRWPIDLRQGALRADNWGSGVGSRFVVGRADHAYFGAKDFANHFEIRCVVCDCKCCCHVQKDASGCVVSQYDFDRLGWLIS